MADALRILCVHGVGNHQANLGWETEWRRVITAGIARWGARDVDVQFVLYDDLFAAAPLDARRVAEALARLLASGMVHGIGDLFRRREFGLPERMRWTAGMVVQWAEDEKLRRETRARLRKSIADLDPHIVCAHSLGSLVAYDTFVQPDGRAAIADRTFVSFGSQIGNPFVRAQFGGRIVALAGARRWFHLYNRNDDAFTSPITLDAADNYEQIETRFDIAGFLDHDAVSYLGHPETVQRVWAQGADTRAYRSLARARGKVVHVRRTTWQATRRALLIGINDYPDPQNRLEGCVNDVFEMSATLQERGFEAEDIRVVLNGRATAGGIRERLSWLFENVKDGDQRVLFYSGHGAQLPAYSPSEKVDHVDECLVAHDFDWSRERAIVDDELFELYSQLPYGAHVLMILDCCHSGGMTREGGPRVRGLMPPDDIRHRALHWEPGLGMWSSRQLPVPARSLADKRWTPEYLGRNGATYRLGRAVPLRALPTRAYNATRNRLDHRGPFLPIILQACGEEELAAEYQHGATSYGAFTFTITRLLRQAGSKPIVLQRLVADTGENLRKLGYQQRPEIVGPKKVISTPLPLTAAGPTRRTVRRPRRA